MIPEVIEHLAREDWEVRHRLDTDLPLWRDLSEHHREALRTVYRHRVAHVASILLKELTTKQVIETLARRRAARTDAEWEGYTENRRAEFCDEAQQHLEEIAAVFAPLATTARRNEAQESVADSDPWCHGDLPIDP